MNPECEDLKSEYEKSVNGVFSRIPWKYHGILYPRFRRLEHGINEHGYEACGQIVENLYAQTPPEYHGILADSLDDIERIGESCDCRCLNFRLSDSVIR
ncbi:MAG: hypothetical protein J4473_03160 [Candidatus Aenigmarchaeota archaeon]|nr:hypothetical protein [Candidatus Aenigmarchaeota archaeon]